MLVFITDNPGPIPVSRERFSSIKSSAFGIQLANPNLGFSDWWRIRLKAIARKDKNRVGDDALIMADVSEKAIGQLRAYVHEILRGARRPHEWSA